MITLNDKIFIPLLTEKALQKRIEEIALQLDLDYAKKKPLFIGVLNGSFMFLAELFKYLKMECRLSFVKVESYKEMNSTGQVTEIIGLNETIENNHVILVEDIIDTGQTLAQLLPKIEANKPASIAILTLLHKKEANKIIKSIDYVGFEIDNKFVIGFGLDYNGYGRNSSEILVLKE